jgi:MoxR-like ATPase
MYEYAPLGINLTMAQTFKEGLGEIRPSGAHLYPGGMGQIVPSEAHIFGEDLSSGIENCGCGCQNRSLGFVQLAERPWWHWLAIGAGIGGLIYMAKKGGLIGNPEDLTDAQAVQQAAALAVQANIPIILWGAPGIGKTSWLEALGNAMGAKVFTVIGSTKDPADIGGIMDLEGRLIPPIWAAEIRKRSLAGKKSVLFLDEFSSMTPLVQASLLRVVRDKVAGETDFDPKHEGKGKGRAVHVVCAANRPEEGAGSIDLPPPAANRLIHFSWPTPSPLEWAQGVITGKWSVPKLEILPDGWRRSSAMRGAKEDIAAFVQAREEFLLSMPKTEKEAGEAWASPRSWEMAAEALGAARFAGSPLDVQQELVKGAVSNDIALEFFNYLEKRDLPDPEDILKDPTRWIPPEGRGDVVFAVANSVTRAVGRKPTTERFDAAVKFFLNMVKTTNRKDEVLPAVWDLSQERIRTKTKYEFPDEFFKTFHSIWKRMKSAEKKAKK